ncbi:hypothetical protein FBEOM_3555 [Fusarium beomiforme]|uniref:Uncharacterized protein n=1 Tax=Fusarium beomiforme TaxID=44412 RepID=A0A9P5APF7_9HYPO|nr:hypothetical protein FBEOM_3555 [Fusarium beomiforme]
MAANSHPSSSPKTPSSNSCLCSGSSHGSSRPNSSASTRCSHCSSRARSPPPARPAPGDHDNNVFSHFNLSRSNPAAGGAGGIDPLGQDLGAQWESSKRLDHQLHHSVPDGPKLN